VSVSQRAYPFYAVFTRQTPRVRICVYICRLLAKEDAFG